MSSETEVCEHRLRDRQDHEKATWTPISYLSLLLKVYIETPELGHEMPFLKGNRKMWPSFLLGGTPGRWGGQFKRCVGMHFCEEVCLKLLAVRGGGVRRRRAFSLGLKEQNTRLLSATCQWNLSSFNTAGLHCFFQGNFQAGYLSTSHCVSS